MDPFSRVARPGRFHIDYEHRSSAMIKLGINNFLCFSEGYGMRLCPMISYHSTCSVLQLVGRREVTMAQAVHHYSSH